MNPRLYVDVHILQDVPPANLNRDDTGSPKSARYGGVDRLRVSSQAWKRATRLDFAERMDAAKLGVRTRRVEDVVGQALISAGVTEEYSGTIATALLSQIFTKSKKGAESDYLFFFSRPQVQKLAESVAALPDLWASPDKLKDAVDVKAILGRGHSLDVALFGRMVADLADLNVDAAAQVSHALGTHSAPTQFDYFTAVDDAQTQEETGAGMIGTVEFNSATLYRYATVNVPELLRNIDDRGTALDGLETFMRSFTLSMPTGKQNTFAAHTRPGLVWIVVRGDQPVNYMSAFETPVKAGDSGYLAASIERLANFVDAEARRWGDAPVATAASYNTEGEAARSAFGAPVSFEDAIAAVRSAVESALGDD